ncbi:MAG: dihydropyrimidinase [Chloroflexi bacterium]|nr:dihydropyrimidinase [Chloroflexota bacterium]
MYDILITGGTVVSPQASETLDVAVQGGKVVALAKPGTLPDDAKRQVDAKGLYVLPGVIDPHVHSFSQWLGQKMPGFGVDSMAAACGGTTTIIDFTYPHEGMTLQKAIDDRRTEFQGNACVDFSLHARPHPSWDMLKEVDGAFAQGMPSFKILLHEREGEPPEEALCYALMQQVAQRGGLVGIHAENASICKHFIQKLVSEGKTGTEWFTHSRPAVAEAESVNRMIFFAERTGCAIYFFHISAAASLELIAAAQARGLAVYCETCPHYLVFNDEVYSQADAIQFIRFPPIKSAADQAALWQGVQSGNINCIGTDHVPAYLWYKKQASEGKPFTEMPGGMGQIETTLQVMYTEAVASGKITVNRLVEMLCANPSRIFGLYPRKGTISVGSDADIVLYDPKPHRKLTSSDLHMGLDYTVFEGRTVVGAPTMTIVRGEVAVERGKYVGTPGKGEFLKREIGKEVLGGKLR